MNIITTQAYNYACRFNTPQPKGCSYLKLCGDLYLLYTHSHDPFSDD